MATIAAISSGTPRIRMRGAISITVTAQPRSIALAGDLEPDEAAADDDQADTAEELPPQSQGIVECPEIERFIGALDRKLARPRPGGDEQLVIGGRGTVGRPDEPGGPVDRDHPLVRAQIDVVFGKPLGLENGLWRRLVPGQHDRLGQRRSLVRGVRFLADQGDRTGKAALAESERGTGSRFSGADNDHPGVVTADQPISMKTLPASTLTG